MGRIKRQTYSVSGKPFTELILEIFRFNGRLVVAGDRLTQELGLSTARWQILGAIALAEHPLTVAHIARSMGLQRQSVQRTVDVLIRDGLLETTENPNHQRARLVLFTRQGKQVYSRAIAIQIRWANELVAGVPAKEIIDAVATVRTLRARVERMKHDP
jgi:DNA-binding MarR family transcriptional regulator